MMNMEDISASIRPIAERYGVDRIYMSTGSRAEDRIELSMDSGKLVSMRDIFEFTDELEDLFGTKVRIIDRESVRNKELFQSMMDNEILIYEWEGLREGDCTFILNGPYLDDFAYLMIRITVDDPDHMTESRGLQAHLTKIWARRDSNPSRWFRRPSGLIQATTWARHINSLTDS